jgi:hypothetical protein
MHKGYTQCGLSGKVVLHPDNKVSSIVVTIYIFILSIPSPYEEGRIKVFKTPRKFLIQYLRITIMIA